jgi:superfamily II DNA/RNA helicase
MNNPSTKEVDILVTTIHIVSTLSTMDVYDMTKVKHIVFDEADTLLDDSFSEEVIRFLSRFRFDGSSKDSVVQATLVSATMPRSIESILGEVIPFETLNRITTPGLHRVAKSVPQKFLRVRKMDKPKVILDLVNQTLLSKSPMMIFSNKSQTCHWLSTYLATKGIDCIAVHGKIKPGERRGLLQIYLNGEVDVMVCTDLGSRGIDTIRTKHVVNYEFPRFLADYVHRCGRVGRVGSASGGLITNLISSANEVELVQQIETSVRKDESMQKVNANIKRLLNARYGMYKTIQPIDTKEDE